MLFIEFILQNKEKCTIAVNKIEGIYPHSLLGFIKTISKRPRPRTY